MDFIKRLKAFKKVRAEMKDPQKCFDETVSRLNYYGVTFLGMDILHLDFSFFNPRYIFLLIIMTTFLYADVESAILAGGVGGFAYNIAVMGFGLQGFAKMDAYVYRKKQFNQLFWRVSAILGRNKNINRMNDILKDQMTVVVLFEKVYVVIYGAVFASACIFGPLMSLNSGELQLSFGFQFSFIDTTQWTGYVFTYIYQMLGVIGVIVSSYCNDNAIVLININFLSIIDCIISDLRELSKLSQLEKNSTNKRAAQEQMKTIINQHQEVLELLNLSNNVFSLYFLLSLVCMTGAIAILLVALVWLKWYPGLAFCAVASFQIFALSVLGTLLLAKSEELIDEIYSVTWYDLDPSLQHSLKLILVMSQNIKEISYRFGVMNMKTFVKSHKLVYSFFTMLVTTQE